MALSIRCSVSGHQLLYRVEHSYTRLAHCILSPWAGYADYDAIHSSLQTAPEKVVILCDRGIVPSHVVGGVTEIMDPGAVYLYTGGVEEYGYSGHTPHSACNPAQERTDAEAWLSQGGVLVTHGALFSGLECTTVIWLTRNMGSSSLVRSSIMRAVARLVVITQSGYLVEEIIKKHFTVVAK